MYSVSLVRISAGSKSVFSGFYYEKKVILLDSFIELRSRHIPIVISSGEIRHIGIYGVCTYWVAKSSSFRWFMAASSGLGSEWHRNEKHAGSIQSSRLLLSSGNIITNKLLVQTAESAQAFLCRINSCFCFVQDACFIMPLFC